MRTVRLRAALPALAGAALLTGTLLSTPAQAAGGVRIYQVWYDSPGRDTRSNSSLNAEWVQIRNTGGTAVSLKGWVLKDASDHRYVFRGVSIGAGKYMKIHTGRGTDTATDKYQGRGAYVWNNDRDTATLTRPNGAGVSSCSWAKPGAGHKYC
ncbi:hypothetical protein BIV25_30505 [Streptomyces sp. MUSC 14]|nr:hypothetical protein BIV25_30505 [Streptomyces sp. MUSC 14]